jgi:hypothetical protein
MATTKRRDFTRRVVDHVTDGVVQVLSDGQAYEFKALFTKMFEELKPKNAVSGGEEMIRLRCYEKLQKLIARGLVEKKLKTYRGLKGLEEATSVHTLAKIDAALAAAAQR